MITNNLHTVRTTARFFRCVIQVVFVLGWANEVTHDVVPSFSWNLNHLKLGPSLALPPLWLHPKGVPAPAASNCSGAHRKEAEQKCTVDHRRSSCSAFPLSSLRRSSWAGPVGDRETAFDRQEEAKTCKRLSWLGPVDEREIAIDWQKEAKASTKIRKDDDDGKVDSNKANNSSKRRSSSSLAARDRKRAIETSIRKNSASRRKERGGGGVGSTKKGDIDVFTRANFYQISTV